MFTLAKLLMNRLRFATRFVFFGLLFSLVVVALLGAVVFGQYEQVSTTRLEILGTAHLRDVRKSIDMLQQHRGLTALSKAGDASAGAMAGERRQSLETALRAVSAPLAAGDHAIVQASWDAILRDWEALRDALPGLSEGESFVRHSALVRRMIVHVRFAADHYLLSLDPELITFHLMNQSVYLLPPMTEWSGQLRAQASTAVARKSADAATLANVTALAGLVRDGVETLAESQARLTDLGEARREGLEQQRMKLEIAFAEAQAEIRRHVVDGQYRATGTGMFALASRPVDAAQKLLEATSETLEAELRAREARLVKSGIAKVAGVALALGLMAWLAIGALLGLRESVGRVIEGGARFARGDLQADVVVDSHDELRDIGESFNRMGAQLRELIEGVRNGAGRLSAAAGELSASSGQVAVSTRQQNDSASSMAASVEQLTVSIGHVKDHSRDALRISREAGSLSDEGSAAVQDTASEMRGIARSATEMTAIIENLGRQSGQISRIVQVIQEVAGQTNLLALNAAIEAARAGEQGRGFSVVADEVRKLAERTGQSTQEIAQMVAGIQQGTEQAVGNVHAWSRRVSEGVARAESAGTCVTRLHDGAAQVVTSVNEITNALDEQSTASTQIAQSVERIAQMSEENTAAVASMADAARSLDLLASELVSAVSRFRVGPSPA